MKHYTLYNLCKAIRLLSLVVLMAFGGCFWGWGQTIDPKDKNDFPQKDVPTLVDTIYVEDGATQTLKIPDYRDYYYVRWYRKTSDGQINVTNLQPTKVTYKESYWGDETTEAYLKTTTTNQSYFWLLGFDIINDNNNRKYRQECLSVEYTSTGSVDSVFCDLSFNIDNLGFKPDGDNFKEPTIGKRYKFYIKPASEMKNRLDNLPANEALETIYMTVPSGASYVNLQMDMTPENYFWGETRGSTFTVKVNAISETNLYNSKDAPKLIQLGSRQITQTTTVDVYVEGNDNSTKHLTKFILTPQENSGFKDESDDDFADYEERNPAKFPDKYEQVGVIDFDFDGLVPVEGEGYLDENNNMGITPVDPSKTTYSFMDPSLPWIINKPDYLMPEDAYGLFRSANVEGISKSNNYGEKWAKSYDPDDYTASPSNKQYAWYYAKTTNTSSAKNNSLYDRTYHNTNMDSCGYFYYVNASAQAGRIVTVPIVGTLCANTELTVIAWVADITDADIPPNVNLILRGENSATGASGVLHRFSSGNMRARGGNSNECAKWFQLCYKITLSSDLVGSYSDFSVELQNNAPSSSGADYAIDDIRIYKTKPNISVRRESACDYSTLIVSSDYNTLMRNMGWSDNPNVLANVSLQDPEVRKYRYGIMGNNPYTSDPHKHVGNMYYSITETNLDGQIDYDPDGSGPVPGTQLGDWVTLNKSLLQKGQDLNDQVLQNLSKSMRVAIPTDLNMPGEGIEEHGEVPKTQEEAAMNEIVLNLRALNDFLSDTETKQIYDDEGKADGDPIDIWSEQNLAAAGIVPSDLKLYLDSVSTITMVDDKITGTIQVSEEQINKILTDKEANERYEYWLIKVYDFLQLPRIRCPWQKENTDGEKILCLGAIDVTNTDLKYKGEKGPGDEVAASGEYHVVVFNAEQVHGHSQDGGSVVNFLDDCLLHSPFTVQPSSSFAINTDMTHDGSGCLGSITRIKGNLWVEEVDEIGNVIGEEPIPFEQAYGEDGSYTFDWFIGTLEEYGKYSFDISDDFLDLRGVIKAFRDARTEDKTGYFTKAEIIGSDFYSTHKKDADLLVNLLDSAKLIIGNGKNESDIRWPECVVAMPYVPDITKEDDGTGSEPGTGGKIYQFCVEPQELPLETSAAPKLSVGFPDMDYQGMTASVVPLRLGLRNINDASGSGILLENIPIRKGIEFGSTTGQSLGMPYGEENNNVVYLNDYITPDFIPVAELTDLDATEDNGGSLSIRFRDNVAQYFKEGIDEYRLYIPFGEYSDEDATTEIKGSCGGFAELTLKIVPEYLTWQKDNADVWHNDEHWHQSTKGEIHLSPNDNTDANGDDHDLTEAFSPLYFTKITIPEGKQLELTEGQVTGDILYDMAIDTVIDPDNDSKYKIVPYYVNKVKEIYFKPKATLMNQHLLTYDTARVEFTMTKGTPYWMSSPLQNVYAGDMYAPIAGIQNTPAFGPITFDYKNDTNHRWELPFYQKAWNKAVAYVNDMDNPEHDKEHAEDAVFMKSNWSIEYNDVWVPYGIGKGFYMRVEGDNENVTVRLPKADTEYTYQPTKAAENLSGQGNRTNAGQLAAYQSKTGEVTVKLEELYGENESAEANGEACHYLVGNPYMTYLDMKQFLTKYKDVLEPKYWALANGTTVAVTTSSDTAGTPDVEWTSSATEKGKFDGENLTGIEGLIPPMRAFFVEVKADVTLTEFKFTPDMMASKPAETARTKSVTASAPILTLTAERDGKKGRSVISLRDKADNSYKADEDAVVLLDSELDVPVAYSVAGNRAAQVNAVKRIDNIPVGVYNDTKEEVTLTIEGISQLAEPLYLYDAHTRRSTLLEDDRYTLTVSGASHGRYYLRSSAANGIGDNAIAVYSVENGKVIISGTEGIRNVKVYSLNGAMVKNYMNLNTVQYVFHLPAGIYVVHVDGGDNTSKVEKVIVR